MRFKGFIGPSYTLRSVNVDCQRCVNLFPEVDELQTGKAGEVAALVSTPGLSLLKTLGSGPIRGMWYSSQGKLYVVSGATLYSLDSNFNPTTLGTLQTTSGRVGMSDNGFQLFLCDGTFGYYWDFTALTFTQTTDTNWRGSNVVSYQGGVFIFAQPNSNEIYLSQSQSPLMSTQYFETVISLPSNIVSLLVCHENIWIFKPDCVEIWYNSGATEFPYQEVQGSFIDYGCAAQFSPAKMNNTVFWLGADVTGAGIVLMASGYQPQRISTHAMETAIQNYSTISDATSFCYQEDGHTFYVLNFPTGNATWVYDTITGLWHERAYTSNGVFQRGLPECHAYAYGMNVVGDYSNGNLYQMSSSVYTDNGQMITRMRTSPHIADDLLRVMYHRFQLDIESGVGLDGIGQGTSPQIMLTWSDDGGHKWSNEVWASLGSIGQTKHRAIWRRLGQSRDRVFKVKITDPVKVVLIGVELDTTAGVS